MIDVRSPVFPLRLPFRLGTTSYIVPDDLIPNAEYLAGCIQDMQLVLFDLPDGPSNMPTPADVARLAAIGAARDLTYTVHLIHDLAAPDAQGHSLSLASAQQVIDLTRPLAPHAWVSHLDGRSVRTCAPDDPALHAWQGATATALAQVCAWAGDPEAVAVENLEGYAPDFVAPVVARTAAGRCVDVGHLWLDGVDPLPHLAAALPRLRVVHLHGVQVEAGTRRDHASLAHTPPAALDPVLAWLLEVGFGGVLCLEVFGAEDFAGSLAAVHASLARIHPATATRSDPSTREG
jgi:sugar phosphate isomerase/epimerase